MPKISYFEKYFLEKGFFFLTQENDFLLCTLSDSQYTASGHPLYVKKQYVNNFVQFCDTCTSKLNKKLIL